MKVYGLHEVANTFIVAGREQRIDISNLKLQKLMYYAQAWSLVLRGSPLFAADFEAWVHGPVIPELFRRFKTHRWSTITDQVFSSNDRDLCDFVKDVLRAYGHLTATQLEYLSHVEDPWRIARDKTPPTMPSNAKISLASMKLFYTQKANEQRTAAAQ